MIAQEIRHQQVLQSMGALVVRTDTEGTITWLNSQAEALFGISEAEAEGKPFVGTLVAPEDASARDLAAMISDCSCHPEEYEIRAIFHRTGFGHEVCVAWKIVGITGAEGKSAGVLCVGEDITDYRETEARGIRTDPWKSRLLAGTDIRGEVFDAVFHIAIEISREGREGKKVGTSFVLGDSGKVMERSRQLTLNSFAGQDRALRAVTDLRNKECIKNFAPARRSLRGHRRRVDRGGREAVPGRGGDGGDPIRLRDPAFLGRRDDRYIPFGGGSGLGNGREAHGLP